MIFAQNRVLKGIVFRFIPNLGSRHLAQLNFPRNVALINWENMGDFVLFTSVIRETKLNYPSARLIVVAQRENKELAKKCPYVDKWIWVKGHRKAKLGMGHGVQTSYWKKLVTTYWLLLLHGRKRIDLLIGPDWLLVKNSSQFFSNMLFEKGNPTLEHLKSKVQKNEGIFLDKSHQVSRMLSILKMFDLHITSDEIENWIAPVVANKSLSAEHLQKARPKRILISLGAGQARRNWPIENVKKLISNLEIEFPSFRIDVLGPKSLLTPETNQAFSNNGNLRNLIGKTDLPAVVSLMKSSDLLISNDSGLVHIAASVKLTCVVVSAHPLDGDPWHLHSPNRYHPWKTEFLVIQPQKLLNGCVGSCEADEPHCIKTVTPSQVLKACEDLLANN